MLGRCLVARAEGWAVLSTTAGGSAVPAAVTSTWAPLRQPIFRGLWIATVVSNIGGWMHDVGAGWMMTTLTDSALLVALVQAALTLPFFFFALPAGVLTDLLDRRRFLMLMQLAALVTAGALAILTVLGSVGPITLLVFTFLLGATTAASAPAWQAIVPELVDRPVLPAAVALNGVGVNISRAVGPAVAGFLIAASGPALVYALNAVSFLAVVYVLARWRRQPAATAVAPEHFAPAIVSGLRYIRHAAGFRLVLWRIASFVVGASAVWALLPLVARRELGLDARGYGLLLGSLGLGAILFASQLGWIRRLLPPRRLAAVGAGAFVLVSLALGMVRQAWWLGAIMLLAGAGWLAVVSTLNVGAQAVLPAWVRGRALAVYLLVFNGGMALGSALWGVVAGQIGIGTTLVVAAGVQALVTIATYRLRLEDGRGADTAVAHLWPAHDDGWSGEGAGRHVLTRKSWRVAREEQAAFREAMQGLRTIRLRDGALYWNLFQDPSDAELLHETFVHSSELEHLRSHERVTEADRAVEQAALKFHRGAMAPVVVHFRATES